MAFGKMAFGKDNSGKETTICNKVNEQKCNNQTERHYVNSTCSEGFQRNMDHNSNYGKYSKLRPSPCQCEAAWTGKYCHLKKNCNYYD